MNDIYFITNGIHIVAFAAIMTPLFGLVAVPIAVMTFQTTKDKFGVSTFVAIEKLAYRHRLTKMYIFLVCGLFISVVSAGYGFTSDIWLHHSIVSVLCMGYAGNIAGKRLRDLNRGSFWALFAVLPVLGHIFLWWLAFKSGEAMRTAA